MHRYLLNMIHKNFFAFLFHIPTFLIFSFVRFHLSPPCFHILSLYVCVRFPVSILNLSIILFSHRKSIYVLQLPLRFVCAVLSSIYFFYKMKFLSIHLSFFSSFYLRSFRPKHIFPSAMFLKYVRQTHWLYGLHLSTERNAENHFEDRTTGGFSQISFLWQFHFRQ